MLYTIGYYATPVDKLVEILRANGVTKLIDTRSQPSSRAKGYNRGQLRNALGDFYEWRGNVLGGFDDGPTAQGLADLKAQAEQSDVAVMCWEYAPGECHRHKLIGLPLAKQGLKVRHIFEDQLVCPLALQKAFKSLSEEYECEYWR